MRFRVEAKLGSLAMVIGLKIVVLSLVFKYNHGDGEEKPT
jgi:hypothetical protein